mmetsp:Transcript_29504/g.58820  ORF Transcript_29504/g.58820 Transcript_29504/m.58820 type:complete len:234 (+) Transcript_29504:178-879(+)
MNWNFIRSLLIRHKPFIFLSKMLLLLQRHIQIVFRLRVNEQIRLAHSLSKPDIPILIHNLTEFVTTLASTPRRTKIIVVFDNHNLYKNSVEVDVFDDEGLRSLHIQRKERDVPMRKNVQQHIGQTPARNVHGPIPPRIRRLNVLSQPRIGHGIVVEFHRGVRGVVFGGTTGCEIHAVGPRPVFDEKVVRFWHSLDQEGVPSEAGFEEAAVGFLDAVVGSHFDYGMSTVMGNCG